MEREDPQNKEGSREAPAQTNVVQLGDWIGPRDELVPFGRRLHSRSDEETAEAPPVDLSPPESPPSADDFWGERAASIHDALQAPPDEQLEVERPAPQVAGARRSMRRVRLAGASALVAVAAIGLALVIGPFASGGGPKAHASGMPLASVLTGGVSRIFQMDLARLQPAATRKPRALSARSATPSHSHSGSQPVRYRKTARDAASSHASVRAYTARVAPATRAPTPTSETHSAPTRMSPQVSSTRSTSSSAAVSPTGASGALGPIQSPNG